MDGRVSWQLWLQRVEILYNWEEARIEGTRGKEVLRNVYTDEALLKNRDN